MGGGWVSDLDRGKGVGVADDKGVQAMLETGLAILWFGGGGGGLTRTT